MSNKKKALTIFLLVVGAILMADTFVQNVVIGLPIGLAVFLYGLFWFSAE